MESNYSDEASAPVLSDMASTIALRSMPAPLVADGSVCSPSPFATTKRQRQEIRISPAARTELRLRAKQARLGGGEVVERLLLNEPVPYLYLDADQFREIMGELRRHGRNLNTVARSLNSGAPVLADTISPTIEELRRIWIMLADKIEGTGPTV